MEIKRGSVSQFHLSRDTTSSLRLISTCSGWPKKFFRNGPNVEQLSLLIPTQVKSSRLLRGPQSIQMISFPRFLKSDSRRLRAIQYSNVAQSLSLCLSGWVHL